jgi:hypothetical protein
VQVQLSGRSARCSMADPPSLLAVRPVQRAGATHFLLCALFATGSQGAAEMQTVRKGVSFDLVCHLPN